VASRALSLLFSVRSSSEWPWMRGAARQRMACFIITPGGGDSESPEPAAKCRRAACARQVLTGVGADTARQYTAFTATRNLHAHARGGHVPRVR
jgi:hypothetical protein